MNIKSDIAASLLPDIGTDFYVQAICESDKTFTFSSADEHKIRYRGISVARYRYRFYVQAICESDKTFTFSSADEHKIRVRGSSVPDIGTDFMFK